MSLAMCWDRRGFTLIELAVSLAIGGTVALAAVSAAVAIPDLGERAAIQLEETRRAAAVRHQIRTWLLTAEVSRDMSSLAAFEGRDGPAGDGVDAIRFVSTTRDSRAARRTQILLHVDRRSSTPDSGLVADLLSSGGTHRRVVLAPEITGLEVQYLYRLSGKHRWYQGWSSNVERPLAVRLELLGPERMAPLLRLPITVWLGD